MKLDYSYPEKKPYPGYRETVRPHFTLTQKTVVFVEFYQKTVVFVEFYDFYLTPKY